MSPYTGTPKRQKPLPTVSESQDPSRLIPPALTASEAVPSPGRSPAYQPCRPAGERRGATDWAPRMASWRGWDLRIATQTHLERPDGSHNSGRSAARSVGVREAERASVAPHLAPAWNSAGQGCMIEACSGTSLSRRDST